MAAMDTERSAVLTGRPAVTGREEVWRWTDRGA